MPISTSSRADSRLPRVPLVTAGCLAMFDRAVKGRDFFTALGPLHRAREPSWCHGRPANGRVSPSITTAYPRRGMTLEEAIGQASRPDLEAIAAVAAQFWNARLAARGGTLDVVGDAEWSRRLGNTLRQAGLPLRPVEAAE